MTTTLATIRDRWSRAKPTKTVAFWIAVGAIAVTLILGFTKGGWTTDSSAQIMAESSAEDAVLARLAPICVAQFNADPERTVKLAEFKAVSSAQRSTYIKAQGWATMPGESSPDNRVALECSRQVALLSE